MKVTVPTTVAHPNKDTPLGAALVYCIGGRDFPWYGMVCVLVEPARRKGRRLYCGVRFDETPQGPRRSFLFGNNDPMPCSMLALLQEPPL